MDQLETMEGSEQLQTGSGYQQNKYRQAVGPVALRAAETLIQGRLVGDGNGTTEAAPSQVEDWGEPNGI